MLNGAGLVWDNHACLPLKDVDEYLPQLARYRAAGVDVVTVNIGDSLVPLDRMLRTAASIRHFVKAHPSHYLLGETAADLREAKASGRLAVCLDVEGVHALGAQVSLVEFLYEIGVRWMLMVYNRRNLAGSGCHDPDDEGLTEIGRAMLAEMDRVGMVRCCSHTGYRTAREIIESSDRPVIFSHSNPRALRDHPRNIPDDLIRACAATGGVVGVNGVGLFLGTGPPTAGVIVRNIDYIAQLVGAEHAGLGLDYMFKSSELDEPGRGGPEIWPREWGYGRGTGFAPPEVIPDIRSGLERLGYPTAAIRGILGDNLLRVADAVWR
jgi:membrane dipeptidase